MTGRVVFAKIGWMKYYEGGRGDDPGPIGGGKYNAGGLGGERFNFLPGKDGEILGFVHTGRKGLGKLDGVNLRRVDPTVDLNAQSLDGVLVVFLAVVPPEHHTELGPGTRVVGWYKNATVYDSAEHSESDRSDAYYNLKTRNGAWFRVFWNKRTHPFDLSGKGGMGRTNIRYSYKENGEPDRLEWMNEVLEYIEQCDPENVSPRNVHNEIEVEESRFQNNPRLRKSIEDYAMDQAERYYKKRGYQIERRGKPYDLLCRSETEELFIEVKGTMQSGLTILLTPNEVEQTFLGDSGAAELFIVREIQCAKTDPTLLSEGKVDIYSRWKPSDHRTVPFQFQCDLDKRRLTKTLSISENCTD